MATWPRLEAWIGSLKALLVLSVDLRPWNVRNDTTKQFVKIAETLLQSESFVALPESEKPSTSTFSKELKLIPELAVSVAELYEKQQRTTYQIKEDEESNPVGIGSLFALVSLEGPPFKATAREKYRFDIAGTDYENRSSTKYLHALTLLLLQIGQSELLCPDKTILVQNAIAARTKDATSNKKTAAEASTIDLAEGNGPPRSLRDGAVERCGMEETKNQSARKRKKHNSNTYDEDGELDGEDSDRFRHDPMMALTSVLARRMAREEDEADELRKSKLGNLSSITRAPSEEDGVRAYCTKCGAFISTGDIFCRSCGSKQSG